MDIQTMANDIITYSKISDKPAKMAYKIMNEFISDYKKDLAIFLYKNKRYLFQTELKYIQKQQQAEILEEGCLAALQAVNSGAELTKAIRAGKTKINRSKYLLTKDALYKSVEFKE